MSIFKDAYHTTVGKMHERSIKKVEHLIKEAIIKDGIYNTTLNVDDSKHYKPLFILGDTVNQSNIEIFTHPLLLSYKDTEYLCTDIRLYVKQNTTPENITQNIKNLTEYNFCKSRAVLNLIWLNDRPTMLRSLFGFAASVFTMWLSESISKVYNLDFNERSIIAAVTSIYYQSLFLEDSKFTEEQKQLLVKNASNFTNIPSNNLFSLIDRIEKLDNVNDYCEAISSLVDNIRLKDFNLAMLLTIIANSWYGNNAKEIISIAIEHPPTWIAIVFTALSDKTYKTSSISTFADKLSKRGASDEFMKNYISLVNENMVEPKKRLELQKT